MRIGRIKVSIESIGGVRYFYGRPVGSDRARFPAIIGNPQVVYLEKNRLSRNFQLRETYETYALIDRGVTNEEFDNSCCVIKATPITEAAYLELKDSIEGIRDRDHAFNVIN